MGQSRCLLLCGNRHCHPEAVILSFRSARTLRSELAYEHLNPHSLHDAEIGYDVSGAPTLSRYTLPPPG